MGSGCFDIPGFEAFAQAFAAVAAAMAEQAGMTRWLQKESPRMTGEGIYEKDVYAI
jgi:hypothetical protein